MPVTDELLDSLVHIIRPFPVTSTIFGQRSSPNKQRFCVIFAYYPTFFAAFTLLSSTNTPQDIHLTRRSSPHAEKHEIDLSDTKLGEEIDSEKHDMNLNNVSFRESSIFVGDPEMRRSIVRKFDWRVLTWIAGLSSYLRLWVLSIEAR
ncbi:hypothetical protein BC936DRAFT_137148 [Jimgerdemannia flammicorona]|uniref:Uncharacterized protein n=1 Tax=Jimgerdemannia flammicorona TaxID=994334 RepID=A0A433CXY5_9FUNG|nr:hypothetical protein BC936DRAFT_137148 [Jimgerdemannia flammicorona]